MQPFKYMRRVVAHKDMEAIARFFDKASDPECPGQTGFVLEPYRSQLSSLFKLEEPCSEIAQHPVMLKLDRSSCRLQEPTGYGKLNLHQDKLALGVKDPTAPHCVIWLPLHSIDERTPALDICPMFIPEFFPHVKDPVGYSVMRDQEGWPLFTISHMDLGDALWMHSTTLHRTSIRPWHTKKRMSFDLRFFPT